MKLPVIHGWHRWVGIICALFVLMLSVTGLLLNHTTELKMDERFVVNDLLLNLYNIRPPEPPSAFVLDGDWFSRIGDRLYFNDRELEHRSESLLGVARQQGMLVLGLQDELLLLTEEGQQIEILDGSDGVPAGMTAIGMNEDDELVIRAAEGDWFVDLDALVWEDHDEIAAVWSVERKLPAEIESALMQLYRGKGLTWERVLLDLHSGRFLGVAGVFVVDLVALLFLFLALSGSWMWLRRKP